MKLITEIVQDVEYLTEEKDGKKTMFITGPFLQAEQKNRNGRIYRLPILEREVNKYIAEKIERKCAYGELSHPASAAINLDRVAIMIESLTKQGNDFIGKARITSTPMGDIVKGLISDGAALGVSSRGIGTLKEHKDGYMEVGEDYNLCVAADVVSDPSGPNCFVNGVLENVNFKWDEKNGWAAEAVDLTRKELKTLRKEDVEVMALPLFEQFLAKLSKNKF